MHQFCTIKLRLLGTFVLVTLKKCTHAAIQLFMRAPSVIQRDYVSPTGRQHTHYAVLPEAETFRCICAILGFNVILEYSLILIVGHNGSLVRKVR